jgi:methionyl-tRNA synthetase
MKSILFTILEQIKNLSILLNPIIPIATGKVLTSMNLSIEDISIKSIINKNVLNHDKELKNLEILFKKIENDN